MCVCVCYYVVRKFHQVMPKLSEKQNQVRPLNFWLICEANMYRAVCGVRNMTFPHSRVLKSRNTRNSTIRHTTHSRVAFSRCRRYRGKRGRAFPVGFAIFTRELPAKARESSHRVINFNLAKDERAWNTHVAFSILTPYPQTQDAYMSQYQLSNKTSLFIEWKYKFNNMER